MWGCQLGLLGLVMSAHDQGRYLPESLARELGPTSVRTIGCLDVGLALHEREGRELVDLEIASLRGEVLFGPVIVDVAQTDELEGETSRKSAGAARGLIEPRIAGDVWFTQHVSFGLYAGVNVLDTGGRVLGLSLAWHNRAFDGDMSIW